MATKTNATGADVKGGVDASTAPELRNGYAGLAAIPEGFTTVGTDRLLYKPEHCAKVNPRIQGFLTESVMLGLDTDKPFHALIFRLTKPSVACEGEGDDPAIVEIPAGEEIMIVATEKLKPLIQYANHEEKCAEFIVDVIGKVKLDGGKTMWRYRVAGGPVQDKQKILGAFAFATLGPAQQHAGNGVAQLPGAV
jgi:hypothetical protein